jgi:hypothetical protein
MKDNKEILNLTDEINKVRLSIASPKLIRE